MNPDLARIVSGGTNAVCLLLLVALVLTFLSAIIVPIFLEKFRAFAMRIMSPRTVKNGLAGVFILGVITCWIFCWAEKKYTTVLFDSTIFLGSIFCSFFFFKDVYPSLEDTSAEAKLKRKAAFSYIKSCIILALLVSVVIYYIHQI